MPIKKANSDKKLNFSGDLIEKERQELLSGLGVPEQKKFVPDPFQEESIESVVSGFDTLVVAPTGAGKTFIAFEAIAKAVSLGKRCVYTTPLKALSNSKYNDLKSRFGDVCQVGILTGDRKIDSDSQIIVATTEIYRNELYRLPQGETIVVLDEVHFISDPQRGAVWEESIILTPRSSTLLMLSASISNQSEIGEWIEFVRGKPCRIVVQDLRPVELRYGFLHPDLGVLPLRDKANRLNREIAKYYAGITLDKTGMKLKVPDARVQELKQQRKDRSKAYKERSNRRHDR
jgi:ATP-dependent RNA helicase HelY